MENSNSFALISRTFFNCVSNDDLETIVRHLSEMSQFKEWKAGISEQEVKLLFNPIGPFRGIINNLFKSIVLNEPLEWHADDMKQNKLILSGDAAQRYGVLHLIGDTLEEIIINNGETIESTVYDDLMPMCKNLKTLEFRGNMDFPRSVSIASAHAHSLKKLWISSTESRHNYPSIRYI